MQVCEKFLMKNLLYFITVRQNSEDKKIPAETLMKRYFGLVLKKQVPPTQKRVNIGRFQEAIFRVLRL
jgi:hypothetical protein